MCPWTSVDNWAVHPSYHSPSIVKFAVKSFVPLAYCLLTLPAPVLSVR
jgi:hypothetical protein